MSVVVSGSSFLSTRRPEALGAEIDRPGGGSGQNIWFLGNSQLIISILRAFCSREILEQCGADWEARRVTKGELRLDSGKAASFLSCNMETLGNPEYVSGQVRCDPGLVQFMDMIDRRRGSPTSVSNSSPHLRSVLRRKEPSGRHLPSTASMATNSTVVRSSGSLRKSICMHPYEDCRITASGVEP